MATKSNKPIDITKTGPMGFRQLQEANEQQLMGISPEFQSFMEGLQIATQPTSLYDASSHAQRDIMSPIARGETRTGEQDYWGRSFFDNPTATENQFERLSDIRAENQPWYSKLINGIGKAGVLAVTTAAELAGLIYGVGQGTYDAINAEEGKGGEAWLHGLWDNPVTKALQSINELSEDLMPNYYTQDEQENPWGHFFNANWIGDKLLKNLGFMVGAFYGGIPASWAIGKVGTAAVKSARAASIAERTSMAKRARDIYREANKIDDIVKKDAFLTERLSAAGLTEAERGKKIAEGLDKVNRIAQTTRATSQTIGALGSAVNEGAIEALNNSKDWANVQKRQAQELYQQQLDSLEEREAYGEISPDEAVQAKVLAAQDYEKRMEEIEKGRARMGNADLLLNIPVLMASNMYQLSRLYTRGFDSTRRQMGSIWNGYKLKGSLKDGTLSSSKTKKGALTSAILKSGTEGLEEYLQRAASDGAGEAVSDSIERYIRAGKGEGSKNDVDDYIAGFGKAIADNLDDPNAWEEFFIGAVSSMVGMPVFGAQTKNAYMKLGPVGFAGGIKGNYDEYMEAKKNEEQVARYLNDRINDPNSSFKTLYKHLREHHDYDELLKDAMLTDDKRKFKDIDFESIFKDINAAASAGHLEEFKQLVGYNKDYDAQELNEIMTATTKTIKADEQRAADNARKNILETLIANIEDEESITPAMAKDLASYQDELKDIQERLDADEKSKTDSSVESPYKDKKEGPFIENGLEMDVHNPDKMREILNRNRDDLLDIIDTYLKIRNDIDIESDGRLKDDDLNLLTMMRAKILDYDKRSVEMAENVLDALSPSSSVENFEKLRDAKDKQIKKYEEILKTAENNLANAEKNKASKKEIKGFQDRVDAAKKALDKSKGERTFFNNAVILLNALAEERDTTAAERVAVAKDSGKGIIDRFLSRFDSSKRAINSDEMQNLLMHPGNALALIDVAKSKFSNLDNARTNQVIQDIADLSVLANTKLAYRQKIREFLNGKENINQAYQRIEDKISQEEKDNKSNDLASRLKAVSSMQELDDILNESYQINEEITSSALQKAKQEGDENIKSLIDNYEKVGESRRNITSQAQGLSDEIKGSILSIANTAFNEAIASDSADPNTYFLDYIKDFIKDSKADDANGLAKETGKAFEDILKDLKIAVNSVRTHSKSKIRKRAVDEEVVSEDEQKEVEGLGKVREKKAKEEEEKKKAAEEEEKKEEKKPDTLDTLKASIKEEVQNDKNDINKKSDLSEDLRNRIDEYNKEHSDNPFTESDIYNFIVDILDTEDPSDRVVTGQETDEHIDDEVINADEGKSRRAEYMHKNVKESFKSDHITKYEISLDYKVRHNPKTKQLKAAQDLLEQYKAFDFIDRNYLGYLSREGDIQVHFLMSTDPDVNSSDNPLIFIAIEWKEGRGGTEDIIRKHLGKKKAGALKNANPVTIGDKKYQILGVAGFNAVDSRDDVRSLFKAMQSSINHELQPKIKDSNEPFVVSEKTSVIHEIYTGRLETKNDEHDKKETKVSLYTFMTDQQGMDDRGVSEEWKSESDFQFGVIIDGNTDYKGDPELFESVNSDLARDINGAILLYIPKPDGKMYPIRCARRTVSDWLESTDNAYNLSGEEILKKMLDSDAENPIDNEFLENIISFLGTLFNEDSLISTKMEVRDALLRYFVFDKDAPLHFNDDKVYLIFDGKREDVNGKDFSEKVLNFFYILSNHGIKFSLPAPSRDAVNGRDVIKLGIFETGIRGFYNYNANFTIVPIDGHGKKQFIPDDAADVDDFKNRGNVRGGLVEVEINGEKVTFHVDDDGVATKNGQPVTSEEQNIINLNKELNNGTLPSYKRNRLIMDDRIQKLPKDKQDEILSSIKGFDNVYVLNGWVVIRSNGNTKFIEVGTEKELELRDKIQKEITKILQKDAGEINRLANIKKANRAEERQADDNTEVGEEVKKAPERKAERKAGPTSNNSGRMFKGKTKFNQLNIQAGGLEKELARRKDGISRRIFKEIVENNAQVNEQAVLEELKAIDKEFNQDKKDAVNALLEKIRCGKI